MVSNEVMPEDGTDGYQAVARSVFSFFVSVNNLCLCVILCL